MKTYAGIDLHSSTNFVGMIKAIEKRVAARAKVRKVFEMLCTIPGIDAIWGLIRFRRIGSRRYSAIIKVGDYSSYCRWDESKCLSNGKNKGENNKKTKSDFF